MWLESSESVSRSFDASVLDVTPTSAAGDVRVLYSPVSTDAGASERCAVVLSDAERERGDSFISDDERHLFIQRRAFRRYCAAKAVGPRPLSEFLFSETEKGRPYISDQPNVSFSFASFKRGFIAAWSG